MERLIEELRAMLNLGLHLSAINLALIIPDICGALESENGEATGQKYREWVDTYLAPAYAGNVQGADIYKLRCASLHQGRLNHANRRYEKIVFQTPLRGFVLHNNIINDILQLNSSIFVNDIISGYETWLLANNNNQHLAVNLSESFQLYQNGYPGLMDFGWFIG